MIILNPPFKPIPGGEGNSSKQLVVIELQEDSLIKTIANCRRDGKTYHYLVGKGVVYRCLPAFSLTHTKNPGVHVGVLKGILWDVALLEELIYGHKTVS